MCVCLGAGGNINEIYEWNGLGSAGTLTNSKAKQTDSHQTVAKRFCISACHSATLPLEELRKSAQT